MFECSYCYKSLKSQGEMVIACDCVESALATHKEVNRKIKWEQEKKEAEELQRRERELNRLRRRRIK